MSAVIEYQKLIQAGDLPPLSQVGLEILRLGDRDDVSASQLGRIIVKDAALAAKVLRIANSPFYGLTTRVKTLDHAIVVLGRVSIVSICAAFTLLSTLQKPKPSGHERYAPNALRDHSILTALLARWLAQHLDSTDMSVSAAFLGGLLHDIGELAVAAFYAGHLRSLRDYENNNPGMQSNQAEHAILGFDHQELGAEVLHSWHMPQLYIDMARHHHDTLPTRDAEGSMMSAVLYAADHLAGMLRPWLLKGMSSGYTQSQEWQQAWQSEIATLPGLAMSSLEDLGQHVETVLDEAKTMIE